MTEEEIQLLLQDLSSRLRYGVRLCVPGYLVPYKLLGIDGDVLHIDTPVYDEGDGYFELDCFNIKPYLRPLSSMTEKEQNELSAYCGLATYQLFISVDADNPEIPYNYLILAIDWLNAHHFDYRGLIEKGLAIEAPEGMYESEE